MARLSDTAGSVMRIRRYQFRWQEHNVDIERVWQTRYPIRNLMGTAKFNELDPAAT